MKSKQGQMVGFCYPLSFILQNFFFACLNCFLVGQTSKPVGQTHDCLFSLAGFKDKVSFFFFSPFRLWEGEVHYEKTFFFFFFSPVDAYQWKKKLQSVFTVVDCHCECFNLWYHSWPRVRIWEGCDFDWCRTMYEFGVPTDHFIPSMKPFDTSRASHLTFKTNMRFAEQTNKPERWRET